MTAGFQGTFIISWSQTEVDGLPAPPAGAVQAGAVWSWRGEALRVDGPARLLRLEMAADAADLRRRAACAVRRLAGAVPGGLAADGAAAPAQAPEPEPQPLSGRHFVVTDGVRSYRLTLIGAAAGQGELLMSLDGIPPRGTDLWVVRQALQPAPPAPAAAQGGVICFTPGTRIATPQGPRPVEDLRAGDLVLTRDSGPQPLRWTGARRISGARLHVMPHLRPVRISAGALGLGQPQPGLLVSPGHRLLLRGPRVRDLFNTPEVLAAAADLADGRSIRLDTSVRQVTYIHLLLDRHQVLWANGAAAESFHPANADLSLLDSGDRDRLLRLLPDVGRDPLSYGAPARRSLSASEAAILGAAAA